MSLLVIAASLWVEVVTRIESDGLYLDERARTTITMTDSEPGARQFGQFV